MTRSQLAGYCLVASAFVLTALLLVQASRLIGNPAHAEMVVNRNAVTMVTTQSPLADTEILYVLDSQQQVLVAYTINPNRNIFEVMGALDVGAVFQQYLTGGAAAPDAGGGRRAR